MGRRLGQHFLTSKSVARELAEAAHITPDVTIVEIGPGKGALTDILLTYNAPITAIEKDMALIAYLHEKYAHEIAHNTLHIVEGDVRDFTPSGSYVLAANIPYYITGEIMRQFLTAPVQPRTMALLIQKEVAQRIVARDGKESILSLSVKAYGTPRIVVKVSRKSFSPPPAVDSAVIAIDNISRAFFDTITENNFFAVVRAGFASKRKLLLNNLAAICSKEQLQHTFIECGLDAKTRAEDVSLAQWKCLTIGCHRA